MATASRGAGIRGSILLGLVLAGAGLRAGPELERAHRDAIAAFYPVMVAHVAEGRFEAARDLCRQAIEWEPREVTHVYNMACIEARAGSPDAAFGWLGKAVELGLDAWDAVDADPDMASLRGDPRYAALRARVLGVKGTAAIPPPPPPPPGPGAVRPPVPAVPAPAPAPVPAPGGPPPARWDGGLPVGLFFMTRYSSYSRSLEKAAWYFAPEGKVYRNLATGFSPADLAAHPGPNGQARLAGGELRVEWAGGEATQSPVEADATGFMWDMGNFQPAQPIRDMASIAGRYEGGESLHGSGGMIGVGRSLELKPDGTYRQGSASSFSVGDEGSRAVGGASGEQSGRWNFSDWSILFAGHDGSTRRVLAFAYDDAGTPAYPDWLFVGGMLFRRR